jgi:indolepyruvate ferredoxin oxidoreductase
VPTEFGRKTRVHQSSCNQDFSCLKGDCPSFLLVTPAGNKRPAPPAPPADLPAPVPRVPGDVLVRMPGIGGTGVVTISAILQMAAHLDGRFAAGVEQTGLAQKGGPVISDVRIAGTPIEGHLRASTGSADVILGFDLLGAAAADTLAVADARRTVAVLNSGTLPTAAMVTDPGASAVPTELALRRVREATREAVEIDALALAERLFDDHMPANTIVLGAAFQHGYLPVSAQSIEQAIRLNGAAVELNLAAFRWGRAVAADPGATAAAGVPAWAGSGHPQPAPLAARAILERSGTEGELRRLLEIRVPELLAYQDARYALRYAHAVARVATAERARSGSTIVAEAYARGLFKLMAYKDEYEVARLHLDATERARVAERFGDAAKVEILLHPPLLRAVGMQRKLRVGPWARPALRALHGARRLRGTPLDPFGRTEVRRVERGLVAEYTALVDEALEHLREDNAAQVAEVAALADVVRGYEQLKLRSVERFRSRGRELLAGLAAVDRPLVVHRGESGGGASVGRSGRPAGRGGGGSPT